MLINYIILAHKKPRQLERLINRLDAIDVNFYVHIDKTVDSAPFYELLNENKNVFFLKGKDRKTTPWSNIGSVNAIMAAKKLCVSGTKERGYCVLLSGQDYPLVDNIRIRGFLEANYGKNFINIEDVKTIWPHWKTRYERYNFHLPKKRTERGIYPIIDSRFFTSQNLKDIIFISLNFGLKKSLKAVFAKRRKPPLLPVPKGGSAWWALPIETVIEIIAYLNEQPAFLDYHRYTHVPDETIFHTVVNELKSPTTIEKSLTYVNWSRKNVALPVTFQTHLDFVELSTLQEDFLFARKFDNTASSDILELLDKRHLMKETK